MTPKEKAKEIFEKYYNIDEFGYYRDKDGFIVWSTSVLEKQAKQCALITVNELIQYSPNKPVDEIDPIEYFTKVKQEIEKL